jgi:HD superfamily phosphohydrolase
MMAEQLRLPPDEVELVRQAALLHDVGHGPFSHVSENMLKRYAKPESIPEGQKKEKIHELITAHLIANDRQILDILGRHTCNRIAKLLSTGHGQPALRSIVSGPLDADKQDYLLRDSLFCGVQYGVFDIHQFHRSLTLYGPEDEKELMITPDGVHAVEQYVLAKYSISEGYAEAYLEVYAPVIWDTRADRQKLRSSLERPITECVESICR